MVSIIFFQSLKYFLKHFLHKLVAILKVYFCCCLFWHSWLLFSPLFSYFALFLFPFIFLYFLCFITAVFLMLVLSMYLQNINWGINTQVSSFLYQSSSSRLFGSIPPICDFVISDFVPKGGNLRYQSLNSNTLPFPMVIHLNTSFKLGLACIFMEHIKLTMHSSFRAHGFKVKICHLLCLTALSARLTSESVSKDLNSKRLTERENV